MAFIDFKPELTPDEPINKENDPERVSDSVSSSGIEESKGDIEIL